MIYAIEAIGLDRVKFGKAKDPKARFKTLSTGSPVPLQLIIIAPWPDLYEGVIHRAFNSERITGEWFLATKRVEEFCHLMGAPGLTEIERFEKSMAYIDGLKCLEGAAKRLATGPENQSDRKVRGSTPPTFANSPSSSGRTAGLGPANGGSNPSGETKPLTPAERQRKRRERLRADPAKWLEHLESDRSRKAAKRGQQAPHEEEA